LLLTYIGLEDTGGFNNSVWDCSYDYTFTNESTSSTASGNLVTSLAGGNSWITILVVVGFAVIVLGMLSEGLWKKQLVVLVEWLDQLDTLTNYLIFEIK